MKYIIELDIDINNIVKVVKEDGYEELEDIYWIIGDYVSDEVSNFLCESDMETEYEDIYKEVIKKLNVIT